MFVESVSNVFLPNFGLQTELPQNILEDRPEAGQPMSVHNPSISELTRQPKSGYYVSTFHYGMCSIVKSAQ